MSDQAEVARLRLRVSQFRAAADDSRAVAAEYDAKADDYQSVLNATLAE